jgi:hypothetical protein
VLAEELVGQGVSVVAPQWLGGLDGEFHGFVGGVAGEVVEKPARFTSRLKVHEVIDRLGPGGGGDEDGLDAFPKTPVPGALEDAKHDMGILDRAENAQSSELRCRALSGFEDDFRIHEPPQFQGAASAILHPHRGEGRSVQSEAEQRERGLGTVQFVEPRPVSGDATNPGEAVFAQLGDESPIVVGLRPADDGAGKVGARIPLVAGGTRVEDDLFPVSGLAYRARGRAEAGQKCLEIAGGLFSALREADSGLVRL